MAVVARKIQGRELMESVSFYQNEWIKRDLCVIGTNTADRIQQTATPERKPPNRYVSA